MTAADDDVALAHRLAGVADAISRGWFEREPAVRIKADGTAVSEVDLAVDRALVDLLERERPGDDVLSEESGTTLGKAHRERRWILDPVDGTDPFLSGGTAWGTHVALEVDGILQIAVLTRPTEQRRWWAVRDRGAWSSPDAAPTDTRRRLAVSTTADLARARIGGFVDVRSTLAAAVRGSAHWVEDPLGPIVALIEGRVDAVLGPAGAVWDHAPQVLLITEAGGRYTDRTGGTRLDMGGGLYTNGRLDGPIGALPSLRPADWPV